MVWWMVWWCGVVNIDDSANKSSLFAVECGVCMCGVVVGVTIVRL